MYILALVPGVTKESIVWQDEMIRVIICEGANQRRGINLRGHRGIVCYVGRVVDRVRDVLGTI